MSDVLVGPQKVNWAGGVLWGCYKLNGQVVTGVGWREMGNSTFKPSCGQSDRVGTDARLSVASEGRSDGRQGSARGARTPLDVPARGITNERRPGVLSRKNGTRYHGGACVVTIDRVLVMRRSRVRRWVASPAWAVAGSKPNRITDCDLCGFL